MANKKHDGNSQHGPYRHQNHRRPVTRREFLGQGFIGGLGIAMGPSLLGLLARTPDAYAAAAECGIDAPTAAMKRIPFVAFDLAGGANLAGSNVLVGQNGGQLDPLDAAGYVKLGLPNGMHPTDAAQTSNELGVWFHADSALLRGIKDKASAATLANVNGCVFCARSNDDTQNNPHSPLYGIAKAGASGDLVTLIGTRNSVSGGNSVAPASQIEASLQPTKVASAADTRGLVDTGRLATLLGGNGSVRVMQAIESISATKGGKLSEAEIVKTMLGCAYSGTTEKVQQYGNPDVLNPVLDTDIAAIFPSQLGDSDFIKTAAIMKLVVNGFAGAGTVQFGGYDYHTGNRSAGEAKDFKAGQAIGAVMQYAALLNKPVMIYLFSDGAVSSNGKIDNSTGGRGKGVWTSDNGTCAASLILVYNPNSRPQLRSETSQQIGYYRANGAIETAATAVSNNVTQLAEAVVLNYLALHGDQGRFLQVLPTQGLGPASGWDQYIAFQPI